MADAGSLISESPGGLGTSDRGPYRLPGIGYTRCPKCPTSDLHNPVCIGHPPVSGA